MDDPVVIFWLSCRQLLMFHNTGMHIETQRHLGSVGKQEANVNLEARFMLLFIQGEITILRKDIIHYGS
jgi:hypothetical protein